MPCLLENAFLVIHDFFFVQHVIDLMSNFRMSKLTTYLYLETKPPGGRPKPRLLSSLFILHFAHFLTSQFPEFGPPATLHCEP